jgi:death-on-curing protein
MLFLDGMMVRAIHSDLIRRYGGSHGLRDPALLGSTLIRPEQLAHDEPDTDVGGLAAVLGWGLLKNHAFVGGNKRIALASVVTFLKLNGYRLMCSQVEETAMVLLAASSEIDEAEWMAWVGRSVGALKRIEESVV